MDIKRYDVGGDNGYGYCDEEEQGDWVLFHDHYAVVASLQAELTKAQELLHKYFVKPDKCAFAARDIGEFLLEKKTCDKCNGTMVVDDCEINSSGGVDFENGPVQCIKDCPDCLTAAKGLTKQCPNQCDGCQAGIPVEVNQYGRPLHRMGCEGGYPYYMACTAKVYLKD